MNNDFKVCKWDNVSIIDEGVAVKTVSVSTLVENLLTFLSDNFGADHEEIDHVIIENQPALKNATMKTLAIVLYTYFKMMNMNIGNFNNIRFIPASNKLKCKKAIPFVNNIKKYSDRKKTAIKVTLEYLNDNDNIKTEWFVGHKKKDDLADSYLAAIHFFETVR
jgi:hypothetical protein